MNLSNDTTKLISNYLLCHGMEIKDPIVYFGIKKISNFSFSLRDIDQLYYLGGNAFIGCDIIGRLKTNSYYFRYSYRRQMIPDEILFITDDKHQFVECLKIEKKIDYNLIVTLINGSNKKKRKFEDENDYDNKKARNFMNDKIKTIKLENDINTKKKRKFFEEDNDDSIKKKRKFEEDNENINIKSIMRMNESKLVKEKLENSCIRDMYSLLFSNLNLICYIDCNNTKPQNTLYSISKVRTYFSFIPIEDISKIYSSQHIDRNKWCISGRMTEAFGLDKYFYILNHRDDSTNSHYICYKIFGDKSLLKDIPILE